MTYELIWSLKNGDLEQVKEHFDSNVSHVYLNLFLMYFFILQLI